MAKSVAASLAVATARLACPLRSPRPHQAGVVGVEWSPCAAARPLRTSSNTPTARWPRDPSVGWSKDGLAYSLRLALDREHARRAVGWDTTPDADEEAALTRIHR